MKWFKFYGQDYLSDPKMLSLSASERSCWITLLCYSSVNDNGMITFISEDQLMLQAGLWVTSDEWDRTIGVLKKLEKMEMITIDNEVITVKNWQKRQETNLTSYERVKRFRQKKQEDNAMITLEENRIDKNRIDKNRINTNTPAKKDRIGKVTSNVNVAEENKAIPLVIDLFKEINPSYKKLFGNKTQRKAVQNLLERVGFEQLQKVILLLPRTNKMPYLPTITTPLQLEDKWASLEAGLTKVKLKNNESSRGLA